MRLKTQLWKLSSANTYMSLLLSPFRHLLGIVTTALFVVITVIVFIPLMPLALLKWLIPYNPWRVLCNRWLDWLASHWMDANAQSPYFITDLQEIKTTWHPIENIGGAKAGY